MGSRSMTVRRHEEICRRLNEGRRLREIARALGCSRRTVREVREVRDGERGLGHPLKFLWEEKAQHLITYSNFWKQFYRKFPQFRQASVTAREFEPGERIEVDYAGDPIECVEMKTRLIHKAYVFVLALGLS